MALEVDRRGVLTTCRARGGQGAALHVKWTNSQVGRRRIGRRKKKRKGRRRQEKHDNLARLSYRR